VNAFGPHTSTPAELQRRLLAEARGEPFLIVRDADGTEQIVALGESRSTVGRGPGVDLALDADQEVSRLHAEIEPIGNAYVLCDDGLSQNGSFVNGERVAGRRKLHDGDTLRFGSTQMLFRAPDADEVGETRPAKDVPLVTLSPTQRLVLAALCRPYRDGGTYARPATNRQIAEEVFLSVDAVKTHMRALFQKLGVEGFPQNEKRLRLVESAFQSGVISPREL
jgi:hypothetical protein